MSEPPEGGDRPDLADEARRIAGAVQDWLQNAPARAAQRSAGDDATAAHDPGADGHRGPDCEWCPICRLAAVIRAERPEVTERLAEAGAAMSAAIKALVEAAAAHLPDAAESGTAAAQAGGPAPTDTSGPTTPAARPDTARSGGRRPRPGRPGTGG